MLRSRNQSHVIAVASFACALLLVTTLQAASPRLTNITPRGVRRGAEHTLEFHGSNLGDTAEVFFYEPGCFEVLQIEPDDKAAKVTVRVADNCRLGEHVAQVRTASGISDRRNPFAGIRKRCFQADWIDELG